MIPGSADSASVPGRASPAPTAGGGDAGLAGALAAALSKRKTRVGQSGEQGQPSFATVDCGTNAVIQTMRTRTMTGMRHPKEKMKSWSSHGVLWACRC